MIKELWVHWTGKRPKNLDPDTARLYLQAGDRSGPDYY